MSLQLFLAMLEPRYSSVLGSPRGGGHLDSTGVSGLETAVDLSRKTSVSEASPGSASARTHHRRRMSEMEADNDDSEDDAPLDLKVRPSSSMSFSPIPGPQQRAELIRIAERLYTTGTPSNASRESSKDRDVDACSFCGADTRSSGFVASEHAEGVCNRGSIACTLCAKTFTLYSHYEAHKKCHQKLKQRQYPCQTCGKIFTSASNRNMHQRIHKGVRPFQCAPCGVFFRQKAHLQKHQKTQGHIQASEVYEKKRRDGLITDEDAHSQTAIGKDEEESLRSDDSTADEQLLADSTQSPAGSPIVAAAADSSSSSSSSSSSPASSSSPPFKSSPKRKQSRPQFHRSSSSGASPQPSEPEQTLEERVRSFIDYNDTTHGYECGQCAFASHDLSVLKEHVRDEHLGTRDGLLRCKDCQITFSKEFNLRIHNRKHETSSQFLPCDHCEQVFKVPNKLIKHMEGVHSVCPTCGDQLEDKAGLARHAEDAHGEARSKYAQVMHYTPISGLMASAASGANNNTTRLGKGLKVDSLADSIRQKQLQHATSAINGNDVKMPSAMTSTSTPIHPTSSSRRKKNDVRALLGSHGGCKSPEPYDLHHPSVADLLRKSENNNILSPGGLKLPPSVQLPTRPVSPPSPPPPPQHFMLPFVSRSQVHPHSDHDSDEADHEDVGLDLTVRKRKSDDDDRVSTTTMVLPPPHFSATDLYRLQFAPPPVPFPFFPFPPSAADHPSIAEQLLKLRAAPPTAPPPAPPTDLKAPYSVLSAMLGHPAPYQPVFPGMTALFPPAPSPKEVVCPSPAPNPAPVLESKPFRCTYCRKEFGHLSSLESHLEHVHSGEAKHVCDTCGKNFSSKSNLTAHKKIHSGERPFECATCHKRFRQKAHLQKHETTHSSATPYACSVCDKAFGHISNLNTHMATHSSVRPYHCDDCGKSYKDSASFKRHRLGHTGERPYPCSLCAEAFIDSKSLRRHREVAHPTANNNDLDSLGDDDEDDGAIDDDEAIDDEEATEEEDAAVGTTTAVANTTATSDYSSFESHEEQQPDEAKDRK